MHSTFGHKTYDLSFLIDQIKIGNIALPDLQRPFIWENIKVRNLFDSLYKGLPIGYILLWETSTQSKKHKNIGTNEKLADPRFLVIDGQQRLTSLFAVIKGLPVRDGDFQEKKIKIAFHPLEEKFEVFNPAIGKNIEWIHDISELFNATSDYHFVANFLAKVKDKRDLTIDEENKISESISNLKAILGYNMTVLELVPSLDVEEVSEIFVRINSQGVTLKQSDFILTLMSVYWEDGRKELESFCEQAKRAPETNEPSSYNSLVKPLPENIVRTIVGYAFLRGRLRYAYLTLQGKDLEDRTAGISEHLRTANFNKFKQAQERALDLTNWHDFINLITSAGFTNDSLISSKAAFYVSYALYLLGKDKFKLEHKELNKTIKKWLYFSLLTNRYTGSPESTIEQDFTSIVKSKTFIDPIETIINTTLTKDYWEITLPQSMVSSSAQNTGFLMYLAAQNVLDEYVAFSDIKVRDLLKNQSEINFKKNPIDKHHLFPKAHLNRKGVTSLTEQNQVANMIWLEYKDNVKISDTAPPIYWKTLTKGMTEKEISSLKQSQAIPEQFPNIEYDEFLAARRKLMAKIIKKGFERL